jgi:DNA (cytosine-5)-methyltransferase 1
MGWDNVFHCEWNDFGKRVLNYYWPNAISYDDITKTDFTIHRGQIDILTGGFPCQPYSSAGKRLGKEDARHLWPEMLRAIREIKPRYVVGENVSGLLSWNGGLVFNEVQTDLEAEGYEVQPVLLPACAVNAPHRRDRIWFVAYRSSDGCERTEESKEVNHRGIQEGMEEGHELDSLHESRNATNTDSELPQRRSNKNRPKEAKRYFSSPFQHNTWQNFPTQSPICNGDDGISSRLDGITFSKWRQESIKAGGNAIVPQVAYQIFKALNIE